MKFFQVTILLFMSLPYSRTQTSCDVFEKMTTPTTPDRQFQLSLTLTQDFGIGIYTKFNPAIMKFQTELQEAETMHILTWTNEYKNQFTLLYSIKFDQKVTTMYHQIQLNVGQNYQMISLPIDSNIVTQQWVFLYFGFQYSTKIYTVFLYLKGYEDNVQMAQGYNCDIAYTLNQYFIIGNQIEFFNLYDATTNYIYSTFRGSISFIYLKTTGTCYFSDVTSFLSFASNLVCVLPDSCPATVSVDLIKDVTQFLGYSFIIKTYQYQASRYQISGWAKLNLLDLGEYQTPVLLRATLNQNYQQNSIVGDRVFYFQYRQSNQPEENGFYFSTYSVNTDLTNSEYQSTPEDEWSVSDEFYESALTKWHFFGFQYGLTDPEKNAKLYLYFQEDGSEKIKYFKRTQLEDQTLYFSIGGDKFTQSQLFKGQISNLKFQYCHKSDLAIVKPCHYTCTECTGPTKDDCNLCSNTSITNREYIPSIGQCACKNEFLDNGSSMVCDDSRELFNFVQISEIEEQQQCKYGEFLFENSICLKCPTFNYNNGFYCGDCWSNPRTWYLNPICTYDYILFDITFKSTYQKIYRNSLNIDYYFIDKEKQTLILCQGCTKNDGTSTQVVSINISRESVNAICKPCYKSINGQCILQVSNCLTCKDTSCLTCKQGFVLQDNQCVQCPANCKECAYSNNELVCTLCQDYYGIYEGQCRQCGQHCIICARFIQALYQVDYFRCWKCIDSSKYYVSFDGFNCIENLIPNCDYALDQNSKDVSIDFYHDPVVGNRNGIVQTCFSCKSGYILDAIGNQCLPGALFTVQIQNSPKTYKFGLCKSDPTQNQECNKENCQMCIKQIIFGFDFCVQCKYGYYAMVITGACSPCPKNKNCRSCLEQNKEYKDDWKWNVKLYYSYIFDNHSGVHSFIIYTQPIDARVNEIICTSCRTGNILFNGECLPSCHSSCKRCEIIDGVSTCVECGNTIQGQVQSVSNNICITCPRNCALCIIVSKEESNFVNNKFNPDDSSIQFYGYQCLQQLDLADLYYNWNLNQFTDCSTLKKPCYKSALIQYNAYCSDADYEAALLLQSNQQEFKKTNHKLSTIFSLSQTSHLPNLENGQFYQLMNEKQVKTLKFKINLIYPSNGNCEFFQEGFFNTTLQQNVYTLQNLELEIVGDLSKNVIIKSFIDVNNFTLVTLTQMKFVNEQSYKFLFANNPNSINIQLNNVQFTGTAIDSQYSLQLKVENPSVIGLSNVQFNNFNLLNTDGLIEYTFTKSQEDSFKMVFESVTFREFTSSNSTLVYFNFGKYQRNQVISLNNINFEKVDLSTSRIFYSDQVIDQALSGSITISNFKLFSSKIEDVYFLSLYPFSTVRFDAIEILNSNLIQSYFIITNMLDCKNLLFQNNKLNSSVLIQNDIYDTSESKYSIYLIQFNKNVYDSQQTFINITLKLGSVSIDSYYSQENIFSGTTTQTNTTVMLSSFASTYLQAKNILLSNITSIRATGHPEFSLSNADLINLTNINFDLSSAYHFPSIQQQLSCVENSFSEATRTTLMFLLKFKSMYCDKMKISNQIAVNVPLIYIESETKVNIIQQETIQFTNIEFEKNTLIITSPAKQQSLITIISDQQQNIIFQNSNFSYNHQHSYEQSRYFSSSSIVIESPLSSILLYNITYTQNLITNSQSSNMYIRAFSITITDSQFVNQNLYDYSHLKSSLNWGIDSSQPFYCENLFDILPINSLGGSAYLYGQYIWLENNQIIQSYAESGGAFYIQGTSDTKIVLKGQVFSNCSASLQEGIISQGGAIVVDSTQANLNLLLENCNFTNIASRGEGGSIYIKPSLTQNQLKFNNLTISNSFSLRSGFLEIKYEETISTNYYVTLTNIKINNELAEFNNYLGRLVKLSNNELEIISTSYLIIIQNGHIKIQEFQVQQNQLSGIFHFDQQQYILISKVLIRDCLLYQQPLVKIALNKLSSSELMIFDTEFRNITEIMLQKSSNQSITYLESAQFSCLMNTTSPNSLEKYYQNLTSVLIEKIQVQIASQNGQKSSILSISQVYSYHNLQFNSLVLADNNCSQCIGGLFNVSEIQVTQENTIIQIEKLNLFNNECGKSGCFVLSNPSTYQYDSNNSRLLQESYQFKEFFSVIIKNSQFLSNQADYGAGFVAIQVRVIVYNSIFNHNQARYGGGAIYYVRVNNEKLSLFNTQIIDNNALFGGAVYQTNFAFNTLDSMNLMVYSNQAGQFGQNFVTPPTKLTIQIYQNQTYLNTKTITNNTNSVVDEITIESFTKDFEVYDFIRLPSGQSVSTYKFYSEYQKKYISTNQTLRIIPLNSQDQQMKDLEDTQCSISGRLINSATNDSNNEFSQNFTNYKSVTYNMTSQDYNLDNLIIYFNPNWNSDYALQLKFQCDSIKIPIFDENPPYQLNYYLSNYSLLLNVQSYECQIGEYLRQDDGTCLICDQSQDQYTVLAGVQCKVKDSTKMINVTSTRIQIRPEYWRPSETNEIIEYCKNMPINCEGGWEPGNPSCFEGHIGALCEQCDLYNVEGKGAYSISTVYKCGSCESVGDNSSKIILITLWTLISIAISVNGTVETNEQKALVEKFKKLGLSVNPRTGQSGILIKVLTNYMQIAGAISTFQLQLPSALSSLFSSVGSPLEAMSYSLDCFLVQLAQDSNIEILYFRLIWGLIMPLFYILLFFTFYAFAILIKKAHKNIAVITTTFIFMYLYLQPTLISGFVSLASYRDISNILWVQGNVAYKYNESQHQKWLVTFILPTLLIIVVIIPLFMFYSLHRIKDKLQQFSNRQSWGYLYNEYSNSSYFWEIIKIMQKGLIIIFLTFYEDLIVIKAALIFIIVQLYLMLTKKYRPFQTDILNLYDEQSSIICGVSIVLGIAIYSAIVSNNQEIVWPFYILLIIANVYFLLKLLYVIAESQLSIQEQILDKVRDIINKKFPNLRESNSFMKKLLTNQSDQRKRVLERFKIIKKYLFKIAREILEIKNREVIVKKPKGSERLDSEIKSFEDEKFLSNQNPLSIRAGFFKRKKPEQREKEKDLGFHTHFSKSESDESMEEKILALQFKQPTVAFKTSLAQIKTMNEINTNLLCEQKQDTNLVKPFEDESINSDEDGIL